MIRMKILLITTGGTISQEEGDDGAHISKGKVANQGFLDFVRANPKNQRFH